MQRLRLYCVYVLPHDMFWRQWEINGRKKSCKAVRHIDSVIFAVAPSFMHLFPCLSLLYFNVVSEESCLSTACRTGSGKRIKEDTKFCLKQPLFYSSSVSSSFCGHLSQGTLLERIKERSQREQIYCRLNLIKGRSAFKCLLFPWAKRLWASPLSPVRSAQTLPLDAINIERIPWPALPSYNNSVRTKVNASNLISVLVIFSGVVMQAEGGSNVKGGSRSGERLLVSGGLGRKQN